VRRLLQIALMSGILVLAVIGLESILRPILPMPTCERQHCADVEAWDHYSQALSALHERPSK